MKLYLFSPKRKKSKKKIHQDKLPLFQKSVFQKSSALKFCFEAALFKIKSPLCMSWKYEMIERPVSSICQDYSIIVALPAYTPLRTQMCTTVIMVGFLASLCDDIQLNASQHHST